MERTIHTARDNRQYSNFPRQFWSSVIPIVFCERFLKTRFTSNRNIEGQTPGDSETQQQRSETQQGRNSPGILIPTDHTSQPFPHSPSHTPTSTTSDPKLTYTNTPPTEGISPIPDPLTQYQPTTLYPLPKNFLRPTKDSLISSTWINTRTPSSRNLLVLTDVCIESFLLMTPTNPLRKFTAKLTHRSPTP